MTNASPSWQREPRRRRVAPLRLLAVLLAGALVVGSVAYLNRQALRSVYEQITGAEFSGNGSVDVEVVVLKGDTGAEVAKKLFEAGVTKSLEVTLRTIYAENPTFFPGTYVLPSQISSTKALQYLKNPNDAITEKVTIREGLRAKSVYQLLSKTTGLSVSSFENAAKDLKQFDLPKAAPSIEGYLFPATYAFDPGLTAAQILTVLVNRTKEQLMTDGVAKSDWHRVLTFASVVQREARLELDFYKVARVFQNRLDKGMALQSDATVSYGVGGNTFQTSAADRADPNPYNTYKYPGLPIGPISGVGALAIDAALNPAAGEWLYFVSVNLKTGETVFSETYAQHLQAVEVWRAWLRENPDWND